jgi:hypothetical protein
VSQLNPDRRSNRSTSWSRPRSIAGSGATLLALTAAADLLDDQIEAVDDHRFRELSPEYLKQPPEKHCPEWHL